MTGVQPPQSLWEKTAFGTIASLIAAGVVGLWVMSVNMGRIDEKLAAWTLLYEKRFEGMDKRIDEKLATSTMLYEKRFEGMDKKLDRFEADQTRREDMIWRKQKNGD